MSIILAYQQLEGRARKISSPRAASPTLDYFKTTRKHKPTEHGAMVKVSTVYHGSTINCIIL